MKPNIFALPVPGRKIETKVFTDPLQPGPNEPALLAEYAKLAESLQGAETDAERERIQPLLDALNQQIEDERPVKIQLTLQAPDYSASRVIREQARELVTTYCTGTDGQKPKLYPAPDGQPYKLHRDVWAQIGGLVGLQPADKRHQPEGFIAWDVADFLAIQSRMPNAFAAMTDWANELISTGLEPTEGNSAGAPPTS